MSKVNWVRIEDADNGFIVEWSEREEKKEGCMDHCDYNNHKKLFASEKEDEAWTLFKTLKKAEWASEKENSLGAPIKGY